VDKEEIRSTCRLLQGSITYLSITMTITTKGQVTIPLAIRERLGLLPWTEVEFEVDGDAVKIRKKAGPGRRGAKVLEALRRAPRPNAGMSTDQLMALTRGE
jgi:AbrB family looped-hinge helix DNA binding protein